MMEQIYVGVDVAKLWLDIHHPAWPLQPADAQFTRNTMAEATGLSLPDVPPLLHFARRQDMVAWTPTPL